METISLVTTITVVVTIHIAAVTIDIVTKAVLLC